jgi:Xaa-Pro dipeptidase
LNEQILSAIRGRFRDRGLDAYIAYTPSNVFYTTGFQSYFLMQWWRIQGTVLAVFPAEGSLEVGMMVGDFEAEPAQRVSGIRDVRPFRLWPEIRDAQTLQEPLGSEEAETPRPAQFDTGEQDEIVRGLLGDRGEREGAYPCAMGWRSPSWRWRETRRATSAPCAGCAWCCAAGSELTCPRLGGLL